MNRTIPTPQPDPKPRHGRRKWQSKGQRHRAFLEALNATGCATFAAAIVDVDRTTPYVWRTRVPGFAEAWEAALAAPPAPPAPTPGPAVQPYPNTESFARDRIQSQGYQVQRIERQVDGTWKADAKRVPTLPPPQQQRVPSKVTIFPDGRMLEEW